MKEPVHKPNAVLDLQGSPAPMPKFIIVTVENDGTPVVDHTGLDAWAAYSILYAAANELWETLPAAVVRHVAPPAG